MSKFGVPRVYWRKGAWRYMCNERQKALTGKSWIRLGETREEAEAELKRWEGRLFPKSSLDRLLDRYETEIIPAKASQATRSSNLRELKMLRLVFSGMEVDELTTHDIYSWLDARGAQSKVQANHELALLKHAYRYGQRWGLCENNPAAPVQKLKLKSRDRYITDSEFRTFLQHTTPWCRRYALLKYKLGLRQRDMLTLRIDRLRDDGIHLRTSKTGQLVIIPWDDEMRDVIREIKADNLARGRQGDTLFCTRDGEPYNKDGFHSRWQFGMRKAIKASGLERFHEHDIRAKHATDAEERGIDPQNNLGHTARSTTEIYLRSKRTLKVSALGADGFISPPASTTPDSEK